MALPTAWRPDAGPCWVSLRCRVQGSASSGGPWERGVRAGGGEGLGRGVEAPGTDLWGRRVAAPQPPREGHLLLQVVQPAVQLGLAGAEHQKRGRQGACGRRGIAGWASSPQGRPLPRAGPRAGVWGSTRGQRGGPRAPPRPPLNSCPPPQPGTARGPTGGKGRTPQLARGLARGHGPGAALALVLRPSHTCDLEGVLSGPLQRADTQLHQW